ncbi:MAG: transglycosylase SLT domain-containing protein, partial [Desulfatiglandales bacterium]|nr:transglycosylase SLT domain-containing protein [Desulfatiglandales bacterium]
DDRLNEVTSAEIMDRLLEKCLKKTENKLRDALGCFYNLCQGENVSDLPLTPENVPFVNYVFHRFIIEVPEEALAMFDLDRDDRHNDKRLNYDWKKAGEKSGFKHIPLLEATLNKFKNKIYRIDPLLFMALMRRESTFNPLAISPVGAAGLTQIMPKTAKNLGMKNIYMPDYLQQAARLVRRKRKTRKEAIAILFQINENNKPHYASRARALMQKSLRLGKKSRRLFTRYKKELLQKRTDERLQPAQAIEYGLRYFARLMQKQGGDISLALASYNAGPHRVRKFQGIPPYAETVHFRNQVLKSYRNYQRKAMGSI